jgi:hypothetical protein
VSIDVTRALIEYLVELDARRAAIVGALELLRPTAAAPAAASPPPAPLELHRCDQCDDAFATKQGLNMHRARRHRPGSPPAAAPADPPAPELRYESGPVDADKFALRCEDCDFTTPVGPIRPLTAHALIEHGRELLQAERQPRRDTV